jgi:hypothetical protein
MESKMALTYKNLNPIIRLLMIEELNLDISLNKLYQGKRLTTFGLQDWPATLSAAFEVGNDTTLENWLAQPGRLETKEPYTVAGVQKFRKVPVTAASTFSEGEFNRFYIRGVCRQAMNLKATNQGTGLVTAYRARYSENPRPESLAIEGKKFDAETLLLDLRANTSADCINNALGLPPGPNSGMSVCL